MTIEDKRSIMDGVQLINTLQAQIGIMKKKIIDISDKILEQGEGIKESMGATHLNIKMNGKHFSLQKCSMGVEIIDLSIIDLDTKQ